MSLPIPQNAEEITPDWLSVAMGRTVTGCTAQRIGRDESFTGGSLIRLGLDYSETKGPESIIAKLSAKRPAFRKALAEANRREVGFYSRKADRRNLPVPRCCYADFDENSGDSIVLVEDFAQARSGDFVKGCSLKDAQAVIAAMAKVHASYWEEGPAENSWLPEFDFAQCWTDYPARLSQILPDQHLPAGFRRLGDHLADNPHLYAQLLGQGPQTCIHRDLQVDNVLFTPKGAVVLDWQFTGYGNGTSDLGYFLISSLSPEQRRGAERGLVRAYHKALLGQGLTGFALPDCQRGYVLSVLGKLFLTVVATVLFDNSSAHKREWRRADLQRLLSFCDDHEIAPELWTEQC
ncbi:phosphotransferase [Neptunicoccus cionae]|uniref:Aminoglycoside phosphotransferase n=1 Tax=Neptunicoccus cionae TaxID=2035344 RepID=A0A916QX50_9RHOB|nr:phosphotransferase [Amylibacter cionae]GGA19984.1 aminoglycoside phosphotransferase [Amylibacter cionae]